MAYVGQNPKFTTQTYRPQSADPSNPTEGMIQYSDGTARAEGLWIYKNGGWYVVGNEAAGLINHVLNPDFEVDASGWVTYADAAASTPVNGTGGSPASTFVRSTSSPLRGVASGLWSKSAANRQGEGFSYDLSIDTADQGKIQQISFDYTVTTNFVSGDMRVFILDVTNNVLIEPSQRDIQANSGQASYLGYFQASSNSTSYRLIFHTATTSALAYDLKVDNVLEGPIEVGNAAAFISDWQSWTPTGSWSTNTTYSGQLRRVGSNLEVMAKISCSGAPTAAALTINLPSGYVIDTTKMEGEGVNHNLGLATILDNGTQNYNGFLRLETTTSVRVFLDNAAGTYVVPSSVSSTVPFTFASGDYVLISYSVPIVGWSTGVSASEISTSAAIGFRMVKTSSQTISSTSATKVTFTSVAAADTGLDVGGGSDTTNSKWTAPESGLYRICSTLDTSATDAGTGVLGYIYKNGSAYYRTDTAPGTSTSNQLVIECLMSLAKGDYIEIYVQSKGGDASYSVIGNTGFDEKSFVEGFKVNQPAIIAPTEFVGCSYESNAGQSIANNTVQTAVYEDRRYDATNSYNTSTGEYTVPVSGKYLVTTGSALAATGTFSGTEEYFQIIMVDSTQFQRSITYPSTTNVIKSAFVSGVVDCVKGQIIKAAIYQNSGGALNLSTGTQDNFIQITKVS